MPKPSEFDDDVAMGNPGNARALRGGRPAGLCPGGDRQGARVPLAWPAIAAPLVLIEALVVTAASFAASACDHFVSGTADGLQAHPGLAGLNALLVVTASIAMGRYRARAFFRVADNHDRLAAALLAGLLAAITVLFLTETATHISLGGLVLSFATAFPFLALARTGAEKVLREADVVRFLQRERVLLVAQIDKLKLAAANVSGRRLTQVIGGAPLPSGTSVGGFAEELDRLTTLAREANADTIVIYPGPSAQQELQAVVARLSELPSAIVIGTDPTSVSHVGPVGEEVDSALGTLVVRPPLTRAERAWKRGFDLLAAALLLVVLSPLFLFVAILIFIESGRPITFRQTRYGYNREPFRVWKFRTLRSEASIQPFRQVTADDDRITPLGRLLRRSNIDELPQLLNVLAGSMSLVGPRPHPVELDDRFQSMIDNYERRYKLRPGITGWAQVNGLRGQTDTLEKMQQRISYDIYYVSNWSLLFDIRILLLTVLSIKSYKNAR